MDRSTGTQPDRRTSHPSGPRTSAALPIQFSLIRYQPATATIVSPSQLDVCGAATITDFGTCTGQSDPMRQPIVLRYTHESPRMNSENRPA